MALAKERNNHPTDSQMGLVHHAFTFFDNVNSGGDYEDGDRYDQRSRCSTGVGFNENFVIRSGSSSSLSSPNSTGVVYHHQPEEAAQDSVISFKPGFHDNLIMQQPSSSSCFLRFDEQSTDHHEQQQPYSSDLELPRKRLLQNFNSMQTAASTSNMYGSLIINPSRIHDQENHHGGMELFGWPNPQEPDHRHDNIEDLQDSGHNKRPHSEERIQAHKKQCTSATKKGKPKSTQTQSSKDPQSIAAKNRRERISERLKVLQDLVPNGTKVDLVTMLEKAISYVKFLQLQVKVLATDDFWPVQGGKAPELSQVKEAIDAILSSSHRDRNSSSNVK